MNALNSNSIFPENLDVVKYKEEGFELVDKLSFEKCQMIINGLFSENISDDDDLRKQARDFLHSLKLKGYWLACSCHEKDESPVVMSICQRETTLYLRRNKSSPLHKKECIFFSALQENCSGVKESRARLRKSAYFGIYRKVTRVSQASQETEKKNRSPGETTKIPRLARLLFTLLEEAKLHVIQPEKFEEDNLCPEHYAALKEVAKNKLIAPKTKLKNFFWTFPGAFKKATEFMKEAQASWPHSWEPQGLMIVVADAIENNTLECVAGREKYPISVHHPIKYISGRVKMYSPPYLVILTIARSPGEEKFVALDAFALPVFSKQKLFPIESNFERRVLAKLMEVQKTFAVSYNKQVIIEKPLFDITVSDEGERCRPDFILRHNNDKVLVIEVMGSHEEEYLERKRDTHLLMQKIGELKEFDALEAEKTGEWKEKLRKLVQRIYGVVLNPK